MLKLKAALHHWNHWETTLSKELVITRICHNEKEYLSCGLFEDKKAVELRIEKEDKNSILGNIYVGKVDNLVKNINAAFIRTAPDMLCYYDQKTPVKPGQSLVVQVSKDAVKRKNPCVTTNLNFTGKYLVLTTENTILGFSSKMPKETREVIRKWLEPLLDGSYGVVVRTNASYAEKADLINEFEFLKKRLIRIKEIGSHRTAYTLLEEALPFYIEAIRDVYSDDLIRIVTDENVCYDRMHKYLQEYQPVDLDKLEFYEDSLLPLHKLFSVETALDKAIREQVWLPSGGFLVIQQTEAFVSIDVNSGKYVSKKKAQEAYRKVNLEAAWEIARQLRLRNLAGIILVDFINLESEDHKQELLNVFQKHCRKDPIKTKVIDMTPLNIVEVTRQRSRKTLYESL